MSVRTELHENGIEYRICDFEGRIPGGEGIEFLYAKKAWSFDARFNPYLGIAYTLDGVEQPNGLGIEMSQRAFDRDFLWDFMDNPARIAFLQASVQPILDLLDREGMFEGEMEGLF